MGNFSRDTFNRLKQYVSVRLQQGVPLLDSDWNEQDDIRRFELQAFLKWFVEDGIPSGNDGFRILPASEDPNIPQENNFIVKGGDGTAEGAGRCLVQGWEVLNANDKAYSTQEGVAPLTIPTEDTDYIVYLDVWEEEVTSDEDPELLNQDLGVETCVRIQRKWRVRVVEETEYESRFAAKGSDREYYKLAKLHRKANIAEIKEEDITDLRNVGITLTSQEKVEQLEQTLQQLEQDIYGKKNDNLNGNNQPRLEVSLREAVNAMLQGNRLFTQPKEIIDIQSGSYPCAIADRNGGIWLFGKGVKGKSGELLYIPILTENTSKWGNPKKLADITDEPSDPFVIAEPQGTIWVFWVSLKGIHYMRIYDISESSWEKTQKIEEGIFVPSGSMMNYFRVVVDKKGNIWVFWLMDSIINGEDYRGIWYTHNTKTQPDEWQEQKRLNPSDDTTITSSFALADSKGYIWAFWSRYYSLYYKRMKDDVDDSPEKAQELANSRQLRFFALEDQKEDIWVFWCYDDTKNMDIRYIRTKNQAPIAWEEYETLIPKLEVAEHNRLDYLFALEDQRGDIWVFWIYISRDPNRLAEDLWCKRTTDKAADRWGDAQKIASNATHPFALEDHKGDIWVFWNSEQGTSYKKTVQRI